MGRLVLVTGGGRGLGRRIVLHLAARGHVVHVMARAGRESQDAELQQAVAGWISADLADEAALDQALARLAEHQPPFDVVIAAAGVRASGRSLGDGTAAEVRATIAVNLVAPALIARAVMPGMARHGYGRIIFIGSRAGFRGAPGEAAYGSSKAGLVSLVESLSREADGRLVTVNAVCPERFSSPDGAATASGARIIQRTLEEVDRLIEGSANGRSIPVASWRHRLVDAGRQAVRAVRVLLPHS